MLLSENRGEKSSIFYFTMKIALIFKNSIGGNFMFKMKKKSIIAVITVIAMCFLMVACGKSTVSNVPSDEAPEATKRPEGVPADYPNKNIEVIYPFGPGSLNEVYFRLLAAEVEKNEGFKNKFVISFKEGGGGQIGWSTIAKAPNDGYTIGFVQSALLALPISKGVTSFGVDKYSYIFNMMTDPAAIGVLPDSEFNSLTELVDYAKANPEQVSIAVNSLNGSESMALSQIANAAGGAKFNLLAYESEAEAIAAVRGGHVDAFCLQIGDAATEIDSGAVKIIATGDNERSAFLPDVPTFQEQGYDVVSANMRAVGGPVGMPEPIRQYLEDCFIKAAQNPEIAKKALELKMPIQILTGAELKTAWEERVKGLEELWKTNPWE